MLMDQEQGLLHLQAWVSATWSPINSFFSLLILIFHQYPVLKIHFYDTILQDSIRRHPGLEASSKLLKCEGGAGAEGAILPYVCHLQLISTLKIGAYCCQLCQY